MSRYEQHKEKMRNRAAYNAAMREYSEWYQNTGLARPDGADKKRKELFKKHGVTKNLRAG